MGQKGKDEIRTVIVERRVFEWFFFHPLRHSLDVVQVSSHHGRETKSSNRSSRKYSDVPIVKLDRNIRTDTHPHHGIRRVDEKVQASRRNPGKGVGWRSQRNFH